MGLFRNLTIVVLTFVLASLMSLPSQAGLLSWALGDHAGPSRPCLNRALVALLEQIDEPTPILLRFKPRSGGAETTQELISRTPAPDQQQALNKFFARHPNIPKEAYKYYNQRTGVFKYKTKNPIHLSLENGVDELRAIRMNWVDDSSISRRQLESFIDIANKVDDIEIWIVVGDDSISELKNLIRPMPKRMRDRIKLIEQRKGAMDVWAQDGSKPLRESSSTAVPHSEQLRYMHSVQSLADDGYVTLQKSIFYFEGGDIVVGEKHIFMGSASIENVMNRLRISRKEAIDALSTEFGKPVFEVGVATNTYGAPVQPDFHIDLSMAVVKNRITGREVVLLDSQKLAFRSLLGDRKVDDLLKNQDEFYSKLLQATQETDEEVKFIKTLSELRLFNIEKREQLLDRMDVQLRSAGYEVIRVPGLASAQDTPVINYINSIFSGKHAIVPRLGVRILDAEFERTIRSLGYDPIFTTVPQESLCFQGGIRCLTETYRKIPGVR